MEVPLADQAGTLTCNGFKMRRIYFRFSAHWLPSKRSSGKNKTRLFGNYRIFVTKEGPSRK
jgi:hypothetical protein